MSSSTESVKVPQYFEGKYFSLLTRCVPLTGFICIVIRHFFLTNENKNYNILNFYNLNMEFIISNTDQWDVKSIWKKRFFDVAKQLNKNIVSEIIVLI